MGLSRLFDVDICYKIISEDFFLINVNDYIDKLKIFALFFCKKGFQFSNKQLEKIECLTGLKISNRTDLDESKFYAVAVFKKYFEIYVYDSLYIEYLNSTSEYDIINGVVKGEINKNMFDVLGMFEVYYINLSKNFINRYWRFSILQNNCNKYVLNENNILNWQIEYDVMKNISKNLTDELMAYNIYLELNKIVSLDSRFYITEQCNNDYNDVLRNQMINDVDINSLICKSWAEIYYFLIKKYTSIECYIYGLMGKSFGHKYVVLLMGDGSVIAADGTNVVYDQQFNMSATDILRCKLGLPTVNFTFYDQYYINNTSGGLKQSGCVDLLNRFINVIGTKEEIEKFKMLMVSGNFSFNNRLNLFIDFINARKDIDDISMACLFQNLIGLFFSDNDNINYIRYYQEFDSGRYCYVNGIKYMKADALKYVYLIIDKNLGFVEVSHDCLNDKLVSKKFKRI